MAYKLRDESTTEGYRIWRDVDIAASRAPGWLKRQVERTAIDVPAARSWARGQLNDHAPGPPDSYNDNVRDAVCQPCNCDACCAARIVLYVTKAKGRT